MSPPFRTWPIIFLNRFRTLVSLTSAIPHLFTSNSLNYVRAVSTCPTFLCFALWIFISLRMCRWHFYRLRLIVNLSFLYFEKKVPFRHIFYLPISYYVWLFFRGIEVLYSIFKKNDFMLVHVDTICQVNGPIRIYHSKYGPRNNHSNCW